MFFSTNSSSNTKNGHDPFCNLSSPDHSFHLPISFFPFPSPFEVDEEYDNDHHDHDLLHQPLNFSTNSSSSQNNPPISTNNTPYLDQILPTNTTMGMMTMNSDQKKMKKIPPRKRLSKKDRHSKITTARGVRDRRMRLSLPVARQFFGLQDMLGVDKGSKTVEWLLIQAKPEILKLAKERNRLSDAANSASNSSEPDHMMSGIDEVGVVIVDNDHQNLNTKNNNIKIKKKKKMVMRAKQLPRKAMAKESREKARERARARTLEKKNQISIRDSCSDHHHPNFTKISSSSWSSPFETTGELESAGTQSYNNLNLSIEVEKPITSQFDYQFHQNFSSFDIIMPKWSPSDDSTFNFLHQQHEYFEDSDNIFG